eukprot:364563-Chlamydomonas_euryale.AAC.4
MRRESDSVSLAFHVAGISAQIWMGSGGTVRRGVRNRMAHHCVAWLWWLWCACQSTLHDLLLGHLVLHDSVLVAWPGMVWLGVACLSFGALVGVA